MIIMLSQIPYATYTVSSGNVYVADQFGIIPNVASQSDQTDLASAGCATLNPNPTNMLGRLIGANFNSTADQQVVDLNNSIRFRVTKISVLNASLDLTAAQGGVYTGAGKTGTTIVASSQAYTALSASDDALDLTLAAPGIFLPAATKLYLSLTTAQGAAATADLYVFGDVLQSP